AGRFRAVDALRRRARFDACVAELTARLETHWQQAEPPADGPGDDRLRLIFACCHPALPQEGRVALTLRELGGLTTEEIARAFLATPSTIAQRIVRGKARIRELGLPFDLPPPAELASRLDAVLRTVYLVFNEGYSSFAGPSLTRGDLCNE